MKALVRGRRLADAPNPERRVNNRSPGSRGASRRKGITPMSTARPTRNKTQGFPAQRSASERKARGRQRPKGKGNSRGSDLAVKNPDAAGIDVGARAHYVAVPEDVLWFAS
jgi:hypothetical protein